jgi:tetratricopeptide (TPR) repeat protein
VTVFAKRAGRVLCAAVFLALLPCLGLVELDLHDRAIAGRAVLAAEVYKLPPASALRALAFGYNELAADLLWVRTIAYFADHLMTDRDLRHLERHIQNIVALDRWFGAIYKYGPPMLISRGGRRANADAEAAIKLLQQAHRIFPDHWEHPLHIAAYYLDLRSPRPADRSRWKLQAAAWVQRAALIGAELPWLATLAAKIHSEQGQRDLAIRHLEEIYLATQDPAMKAQAAAKLKELRASQLADLVEADRELRSAHAASPTPYVAADLFVFLRQEPLGPFALPRPR